MHWRGHTEPWAIRANDEEEEAGDRTETEKETPNQRASVTEQEIVRAFLLVFVCLSNERYGTHKHSDLVLVRTNTELNGLVIKQKQRENERSLDRAYVTIDPKCTT